MQREAGSPLTRVVAERVWLEGLMSWTQDCRDYDTPAVFTRINYFTGWIQAVTNIAD